MKKQKNVNYYRDLLHKDSITLLVIAIIFAIASFTFIGGGTDEAVPIFLKSIMFAIFSIILICNKKETKKFVGVLTIITSCLMILTSIGDSSLFGVVYFLLGIFLMIHSILYLRKLKNYNIQTGASINNAKIKYLSFMPLALTIFFMILGFIFNQSLIGIFWCSMVIFIVNILGIIFCITLHHRNIRSVLVYIMLVISIMITFFSGIFLIDDIRNYLRKNKYNNSEQYVADLIHYAAGGFSEDSMKIKNQKLFNIHQGENIIPLDDYLDKTKYENSDLNELIKKGYNCVGYLSLTFDDNADYDEYLEEMNDEYYLYSSYTMHGYFKEVKTYIKCDGKYSYQTNGFDDRNIK